MKRVLFIFIAAAWLLATATQALAQNWPQQTIHLIISFGAGGATDIVGRILAEALQDRLGQAVIVENKPGASGVLGNQLVASATPDGYTLGIMTAGQIIAAVTRKDMPYDTAALTPIDLVASGTFLMVTRPDFPANSVVELVAAARAAPGKIILASPGFAATQHFAGELFKLRAGVNLLQVPFRSSPEALNAVLGRHADVLIDAVPAAIGQVQAGNLKPLAVTDKNRFPAVPDVPTVMESGVVPDYDVSSWYGIFGPPGMAPAVVAKLNNTLNEIVADAKVREHLTTAGVIVKGSTPEEFGLLLKHEYQRWDAVREAAGIAQQ
jgi:tripartite-type tricarboxylate transporter receptor subunit TctC